MEFPITLECSVGARHATAHEECRGPLEYKYAAYEAWGLGHDTIRGSFEDFPRDRFVIGDKVSVKEEIARYRELLGVDHFIMRASGRACRRNKRRARSGASAGFSRRRA